MMEPLVQLRERVHTLATRRLHADGVTTSSTEEAIERYAFFQCHTCSIPYYGGLKQCQDGLHEYSQDELLCHKCKGANSIQTHPDTCPIHGKDYIEWKCTFCCCTATYFCGSALQYYCDECHQHSGQVSSACSNGTLPPCPAGPNLTRLSG
ncbi:hypothetical protein KIPB_004551 [Kipferlia bialata]|uniref:Uncharacterized protein n=1 Tax=Kipferlia bialata TaxID=797122 RepID=A0A9K3CW53_9EUKA|nr:hypothetical protein KIPB_004551 [Kipferlia bialata]|eukprot:g4551.t1